MTDVTEGEPDVLVNCTFASLEHPSSMSEIRDRGGTLFQCSIIEAGLTGGRRQEVRLIYCSKECLSEYNSLRFLFSALKVDYSIGDLKFFSSNMPVV